MNIYQIADNNNILNVNIPKNSKDSNPPIKALTVIVSFTFAISAISITTNIKENNISFSQSNLNNNKFETIDTYNSDKSVKNDTIEMKENQLTSMNTNEYWNFNDKKLEVDELVDKVSQTQLNEVKDHFDTKISSLKKDIELMFEQQENKRLSEKLEVINNANKNKKDTIKWFVGTAITLTSLVFAIVTFFY